jgi:hypothetical protein
MTIKIQTFAFPFWAVCWPVPFIRFRPLVTGNQDVLGREGAFFVWAQPTTSIRP